MLEYGRIERKNSDYFEKSSKVNIKRKKNSNKKIINKNKLYKSKNYKNYYLEKRVFCKKQNTKTNEIFNSNKTK